MTLHRDGLHRRPATSKYDQVFGNQPGRPICGDEEIKVFESLLSERSSDLLRKEKSPGIGDTLIGLIPIILLAMVMLFFLFAVLTVIRAFMSVHMKADN